MYTIYLRNVILYGQHGVYESEHLLNAPFEINMKCYLHNDVVVHTLDDTVNYALLFEIVQKHFAIPQQLLEVLAKQIIEEIKLKFAPVEKVEISIFKLNPPIASLQGQVGISLEY